ncbi:hypothetical protein [Celerinatantimonas sp. YJH-8]|uniref:hypothetical protein n=1 Tax=Celerinatantimonas sp. YJH-8 TaxID=3228714 RepID=UPI0038C6F6CD
MQKDLDARITAFLAAFEIAYEASTQIEDHELCFFIVPEFYFHSKHGPYPGIEINHKSALAYIKDQLKNHLEDKLKKSHHSWIITSGGILTTHVKNIAKFLKRSDVKERLKKLNKAYHNINSPTADTLTHVGLTRLKSLNTTHVSTEKEANFNAIVNKYRQDPLCTVRNRSLLFYYEYDSQKVSSYSFEKQGESTVDLTLGKVEDNDIIPDGQITEWLANYPPVSILNGDNQGDGKSKLSSPGARVSLSYAASPIELGLEICLDHRLQRLRRTVNMPHNPDLDVQLIASGGMQLLDYSIAAGMGGVIFNADGCDSILDHYDATGKPVIHENGQIKEVISGVYSLSAQTCVKKGRINYFSHSQLAFRTNESGPSDYINPKTILNTGGHTFLGAAPEVRNPLLDAYHKVTIHQIDPITDTKEFFTAGLGEIHQYSPQ